MITKQQAQEMIGSTVYGSDQQKVGKVGHIFLDNQTDSPAFATVRTGMFGQRESFVPLDGADMRDGDIRVPYDSTRINEAPNVDAEAGNLSPGEERELYHHYGLSQGPSEGSPGATTGAGTGDRTAAETSRSATNTGTGERTAGETSRSATDEEAMTRSEERLHVGKESVETGRARLRKYVVTENVEQTVPVSHEEVRVEREPITDESRDRAAAEPEFTESEQEVTLHEERAVTSKEEVPVERVRLTKETKTEQQRISDQVRKEEIEEDLPENRRNR